MRCREHQHPCDFQTARLIAASRFITDRNAVHAIAERPIVDGRQPQRNPGSRVRIERWGGPGVLQGRVRSVEPAAFTKVSALGVEEQRVNVLIDTSNAVIVLLGFADSLTVPLGLPAAWPTDERHALHLFTILVDQARCGVMRRNWPIWPAPAMGMAWRRPTNATMPVSPQTCSTFRPIASACWPSRMATGMRLRAASSVWLRHDCPNVRQSAAAFKRL